MKKTVKNQKVLMDLYSIRPETKITYHYKNYQYDSFENALNFAMSDQNIRKNE